MTNTDAAHRLLIRLGPLTDAVEELRAVWQHAEANADCPETVERLAGGVEKAVLAVAAALEIVCEGQADV